MDNKVMSHMTKGLIIGLGLVVISIAGNFGGLGEQSWFRWLSNILLAIAIIWACIHYAKQLDGNVTFGSVFAHGFKATAIITLILIAYTILSVTIIFPEIREKGFETARQQLETDGKMTSEQIDQALSIGQKFFWPIAIGVVLLGTLIFGAIASLIGAALAKKNPVTVPQQFNG